MTKNSRLMVNLSAEDMAAVRAAAEAEGRPVSNWIRAAVLAALKAKGGYQGTAAGRSSRAKAA